MGVTWFQYVSKCFNMFQNVSMGFLDILSSYGGERLHQDIVLWLHHGNRSSRRRTDVEQLGSDEFETKWSRHRGGSLPTVHFGIVSSAFRELPLKPKSGCNQLALNTSVPFKSIDGFFRCV